MWPKRCAVCERQYDEPTWQTLYYVGPVDDGRVLWEQRRCVSCGNTLCVRLGPSVDARDTDPAPAPSMSPDETGHEPSYYSPTHGKSDLDED